MAKKASGILEVSAYEGTESGKSSVNTESEKSNTASSGLNKLATVFQVLSVIGIVAALIGVFLYLIFVGSINSPYDWVRANALSYTGVGSALFVFGLAGSFSSYVLCKILKALAVITKASEKYLSK